MIFVYPVTPCKKDGGGPLVVGQQNNKILRDRNVVTYQFLQRFHKDLLADKRYMQNSILTSDPYYFCSVVCTPYTILYEHIKVM